MIINKHDLNYFISNQIETWCAEKDINVTGILLCDENIVKAMIECISIIEFNQELEKSQKIKKIWDRIKNQKM